MSSVNQVVRSLEVSVDDEVREINTQARSKAFRAVNIMQGATYNVLGKDGTGRKYGAHTASVPGAAPAPDSGNLRRNWRRFVVAKNLGKGVQITCRLKSDTPYASCLESGTKRMAARPFRQRIVEQSKPEIVRIFEAVK